MCRCLHTNILEPIERAILHRAEEKEGRLTD